MFSTIDTHDFETKVNQAVKFLQGGDKLKVSVRFRKRAIAHPQLGEELLEHFKEAVSSVGTVDKPAKTADFAVNKILHIVKNCIIRHWPFYNIIVMRFSTSACNNKV